MIVDFSALIAGLSQHVCVDMFCHVSHMLVFNMTVHNMYATVLACTHSNSLYNVLGMGCTHMVTKVILFLGARKLRHCLWRSGARLTL